MKLRNKKTGEIVQDFDGFTTYTTDWSSAKNLHYTSLTKLNEEWEDYKPAEPLIKDEKIRKAVRAWAEALKLANCKYDAYWKAFRFCDQTISLFGLCDSDLEDERIYSIAELCGEEEE